LCHLCDGAQRAEDVLWRLERAAQPPDDDVWQRGIKNWDALKRRAERNGRSAREEHLRQVAWERLVGYVSGVFKGAQRLVPLEQRQILERWETSVRSVLDSSREAATTLFLDGDGAGRSRFRGASQPFPLVCNAPCQLDEHERYRHEIRPLVFFRDRLRMRVFHLDHIIERGRIRRAIAAAAASGAAGDALRVLRVFDLLCGENLRLASGECHDLGSHREVCPPLV